MTVNPRVKPTRLRSWLIPLLALLLVAGLAVIRFALTAPETTPKPVAAKPLVGGPFTLVDHNGRTVTDADFRGKLMVIYFGYSFCPDVCPTTLQTLSNALDKLGAKGASDVQPLFITVDPARDSPAVLKSYVANFSPRLIGLTGSPEQVAQAEREYKVFVQIPVSGKDYLVNHTSILYIMGRQGEFLAALGGDSPPEKIAATIAKYR